MQALSRNTASVAQDFHNAGGGIKKEIIYNTTNINNTSNSSSTNNNHQHHQHQNENILDASLAAAATIGNQKKKFKAMSSSPIERSPPATLNVNHQQHPYVGGFTEVKKRRKITTTPSSLSSNDKENDNELLSKQLCFLKQQHQAFLGNLNASVMSNTERTKAVKEINEIFEKLYKNSLTLISSMELEQKQQDIQIKQEYEERVIVKQEPEEWSQDEEMEDVEKCNKEPYMDTLPEFLRNNKEITIIVEPKIRNKNNNVVVKQEKLSSDEEQQKEGRKGRKQAKPKKIELEAGEKVEEKIPNSLEVITSPKDSQTLVDNLRDKHMVCLVTRKKCCYICRNRDSDSNSYYTKTSLLLHTKWRHSAMPYDCSNCKTKFQRIYKLKLHKKLFQH